MKRKNKIYLLLIVCFIIGCVGLKMRDAKRFQFQKLEQGQFRVMTWNVGYFAPVKNKNAKNVDLKFISETISRVDVDTVMLQELGALDQFEKIQKSLGKPWSGKAIETGHHGQVLAIFTRLKIKKSQSRKLGKRNALALVVESRNQKDIFVLGLHSPHPGRGMDDTIQNIESAVEWVSERQEPVRILAGDFNYNFDPKKSKHRPSELYKNITSVMEDSTASIGETYYFNTRIDHVFHYPKKLKVINKNSGMLDIEFRIAKVPGWRDHRPIVVTYDLEN